MDSIDVAVKAVTVATFVVFAAALALLALHRAKNKPRGPGRP
jgi:hypothetical protein